ncbi:hypothetical protein [Sphingobium yanoikuyae]|uniref:hypothetical protein n=1 Tax=Sphingobium yanoikuyae TaxID=13690 RepID=UPI0022DDFC65|nr:hypothetical protein [Sphingobium yanoikuyae]WBQ17592.1 hypothetical protein PAE53_05120 [Sphingobium yanoikuyae]
MSENYSRASKAEILAYVDGATPQEPCRIQGSCDLEGAADVETVIETLAEIILELQRKFSVSEFHGYSGEALRYGRGFKGLLQIHDNLVVQYEKWHVERWGKAPTYCNLKAEEFAIKS